MGWKQEIAEVLDPVLQTVRCKPLADTDLIFGAILDVDYDSTMRDACYLRLREMAANRADALEQAFDFALAKGTKNEWMRTGEVFADKTQGRIYAFCVSEATGVGAL
jgi:hypothetical protein